MGLVIRGKAAGEKKGVETQGLLAVDPLKPAVVPVEEQEKEVPTGVGIAVRKYELVLEGLAGSKEIRAGALTSSTLSDGSVELRFTTGAELVAEFVVGAGKSYGLIYD